MCILTNDYKGNAHITFIQVKKLNILSILEEISKPDASLSDHSLHPELNQGWYWASRLWGDIKACLDWSRFESYWLLKFLKIVP